MIVNLVRALFLSMFLSGFRSSSAIRLQRLLNINKYRNIRLQMASSTSTYSDPTKQVIILAGATSVGKSSVAMRLCKKLNGAAEIIIADSVQVYKHLDIGSNKPTREDMVEVPHHLVNIAEPHESLSTGEFCRKAADAIIDVLARNKIPVVVGGSTMWIQWLVHGIPDAPPASAEAMARSSELIGTFELERQWDEAVDVLKQYDSARAEKLSKNDWYRLRRYLEIALDQQRISSSSSSASSSEAASTTAGRECIPVVPGADFRTYFLTEDRAQLYRTIDGRCGDMLRAGLVEEVGQLLRAGALTPDVTVARSIGYRQVIDYLADADIGTDGDVPSFTQFVNDFCTATRNYAKRQIGWYRRDPSFLFLEMHREGVRKEAAVDSVALEILHWNAVSRPEFDRVVAGQVDVTKALNDLINSGGSSGSRGSGTSTSGSSSCHVDEGKNNKSKSKSKKRKARVPTDYNLDSDAKRLALAWCIHKEILALPTPPTPPTAPTKGSTDYRYDNNTRNSSSGSSGGGGSGGGNVIAPYEYPPWVSQLFEETNSVTNRRNEFTPDKVGRNYANVRWSAQGIGVRASEGSGGGTERDALRSYQSNVVSEASLAAGLRQVIATADHYRALLRVEKPEVLALFRQNKHFSDGGLSDSSK